MDIEFLIENLTKITQTEWILVKGTSYPHIHTTLFGDAGVDVIMSQLPPSLWPMIGNDKWNRLSVDGRNYLTLIAYFKKPFPPPQDFPVTFTQTSRVQQTFISNYISSSSYVPRLDSRGLVFYCNPPLEYSQYSEMYPQNLFNKLEQTGQELIVSYFAIQAFNDHNTEMFPLYPLVNIFFILNRIQKYLELLPLTQEMKIDWGMDGFTQRLHIRAAKSHQEIVEYVTKLKQIVPFNKANIAISNKVIFDNVEEVYSELWEMQRGDGLRRILSEEQLLIDILNVPFTPSDLLTDQLRPQRRFVLIKESICEHIYIDDLITLINEYLPSETY